MLEKVGKWVSDILVPDWSIAEEKLAEMKQFADDAPGYITLEEPPPDRREEFIQNCEAYDNSEKPI